MFFQPEAAAAARHLLDPDLLTINLVSAFIIEKVKGSRFVPFITQETKSLNRLIASFVSLAATVGVHFATNNPSSGVYVITVSGLTATSVLHAGFDWLKSYIGQEIVYQKLLKNGNGKAVVAASVPR